MVGRTGGQCYSKCGGFHGGTSVADEGKQNAERKAEGRVDPVRVALFSRIYSDEIQARASKRQRIRSYMSEIVVARNSDMTFEEIARSLTEAGLAVTPATLKSYYRDFKAEAQIAGVTQQLRQLVSDTRNALRTERQVKDGVASAAAAAKEVRGLASRPKLVANSDLRHATSDSNQRAEVRPEKAPRRAAEPVSIHSGTRAAAAEAAGTTTAATTAAAAAAPAPAPAPRGPGQGPTIDELRASAGQHEPLREDLVVGPNDRVYYESGEPYESVLTIREVRLLETSRRLLKPSSVETRTGKDFRKLPSTL